MKNILHRIRVYFSISQIDALQAEVKAYKQLIANLQIRQKELQNETL